MGRGGTADSVHGELAWEWETSHRLAGTGYRRRHVARIVRQMVAPRTSRLVCRRCVRSSSPVRHGIASPAQAGCCRRRRSDRILSLTGRRKEVAVITPPRSTASDSFSHIFAGGYAAGYYAQVAEVRSADCFAAFEEEGSLHPRRASSCGKSFGRRQSTGHRLIQSVQGREPRLEALLRHNEWSKRLPATT